MSGAVAVSGQNTLRKLGAHLRWQLEKCGVAAESASMIIVVKDEVDKSKVISGFLRDYDVTTMARDDTSPARIILSGVAVYVTVQQKEN